MPPLAAVPDLERELAELYARPLEEFTAARNDLAVRLKRAHQADRAAEVRALRKPQVGAWVANQLARREQPLLAALLDAADELRSTQERALHGLVGASEVAGALNAERQALRDLVSAARSLLAERASVPLLDRVSQTLLAAATDRTIRPQLERGRLTEELRAVGFGGLEAVVPTTGPRQDAERTRQARRDALRAEAQRSAAAAEAAELEASAAEQHATALRAEAARKRRDAERAAAAVVDDSA